MAGARTRIRIGETQGAPYIEQINYGVPADMQLLNRARYEIEIEDETAFVTVFLQLGDGSPTAITHSPFTGGKFDMGATRASMTALGIDKVALCVPAGDDAEAEEDADAELNEDDEEDSEEEDDSDSEDDDEEEDDSDSEDDEEEGPTLGELADRGDKVAIKQIEAEARAAGIDPDDYETYVEVEELLPEEGDDDDEELDEEEDE